MAKIAASALFWAAVLDVVMASPAAEPAAAPMVTPGPLLRRQAGTQNFIGYYPFSVSGTTTTWDSYTCKAGYTFTSAGNYFKCCSTIGACNLYTGCSGNFLVGPSTSYPCSSLSAGAYCSSDRLFPTPGALQAQSYLWCGTSTDAGTDIFRATFAGGATFPSDVATVSSTSAGGSGSSNTRTTSSTNTGSQTGSSTSGTSSPTQTGSGSSTPVGAIVGGVVGGLAVVGIAAAGIIFLLFRKKRKNAANSEKPVGGAPPAVGGYGQQQQQPVVGGYGQPSPQAGYGQPVNYGAPAAGGAAGYYYDNKGISPQQQQVYPAQNQSPNAGVAYPHNPHDSMYKAPLSPQPPNNAFELDSSQATNYSPNVSQASPHTQTTSPAQQAPVELATPMHSPQPNYARQ